MWNPLVPQIQLAPDRRFFKAVKELLCLKTDPTEITLIELPRTLKANAAARKARKFRQENNERNKDTTTIAADAGFARAALYIRNYSVNMPVNLSNILCSLLFETPQGEIIPVQSFRLRNDDFSIFEIDIYGGSEFGPYVIELTGLNRVEIENAIARGYTPKIFIVDYDMRHVADSNYKAALGQANSFMGENLKIVEENAKGRTALVKIIGPQRRDMFRVVAFDVELSPADADPCNLNNIADNGTVSPGLTLEKALERIACSGDTFEFENYVFDFTWNCASR